MERHQESAPKIEKFNSATLEVFTVKTRMAQKMRDIWSGCLPPQQDDIYSDKFPVFSHFSFSSKKGSDSI